jgi:hypothetical protein
MMQRHQSVAINNNEPVACCYTDGASARLHVRLNVAFIMNHTNAGLDLQIA